MGEAKGWALPDRVGGCSVRMMLMTGRRIAEVRRMAVRRRKLRTMKKRNAIHMMARRGLWVPAERNQGFEEG